MKKRFGIIIGLCLCVFGLVGCKDDKTVQEGKGTHVNLIIQSVSNYANEANFVSEENKSDGYYKQIYNYEGIEFWFERMNHKEYDDFPVATNEKISNLECNNEINSNSSYEGDKATYKTELNNKEYYNEDILINSDDWDFRVHFQVENKEHDKYAEIISDIISNLNISEIN
ncbi:MAG: hypothetical protein RSG52_08560 [Terrisporobacter sp.]|uniref:hypothetical protein n=1 Tax=Terrisporobacter sp. TaxID=1965305 RepID=UPI002FCAE37A